MENCFLLCCHDSLLIGTRSECEIILNKNTHYYSYYHMNNNEYFYCLNRDQLGQYWQCVVGGRDAFCPDRCEKCNACKEMADVFTELQDFFLSKCECCK